MISFFSYSMKNFFSDSPYLSLPASSAVPFDVFQEAEGLWSAFGEIDSN
jgi:hypothetical protein